METGTARSMESLNGGASSLKPGTSSVLDKLSHTAPVRKVTKPEELWNATKLRKETVEGNQWRKKTMTELQSPSKKAASDYDKLVASAQAKQQQTVVWEERDPAQSQQNLEAPSTSLPDLALGYTAPARAHKAKDDMKLFGQRRQKRIKSLNTYVNKFTQQLTDLIDRRRQKNLHFAAEAIFYANKIDSKLQKEGKGARGDDKFDNVVVGDRGLDRGDGLTGLPSEEWRTDVPIKKNVSNLKWVKELVHYTESYPVFAAGDRSGLPSSLDIKIQEYDNSQKTHHMFEQTVFPSLKPERREDAFLLECWLIDVMKRLAVDMKMGEAEGQEADIEDIADAALWIYRTAFEEIARQVHCLCKVKSDLLKRIWDQFFWLLELRAGLKYEEEVDTLAHACESFRKMINSMEQEKSKIEKSYQNKLEASIQERMKIERDASRIAERYALIEQSKKEIDRQLSEANKHHLSEIHNRLAIEERLNEVSRLLRNEKSLHTETNREKLNLMKVVKDMKEEVTEKNKGLNELNSENASLKSQVQSLEMLVARYESQLEQVKTDTIMERNLKEAAQEDLKHLRGVLKKKEVLEKELKAQNNQLINTNKNLEDDLSTTRQELADKCADHEKLLHDFEQLEEKYNQRTKDLKENQSTLDREREENASTMKEMNNKATERDSTISNLNNEVERQKLEISDLNRQVQKHTSAHNSLRAVLEPIAGELEEKQDYDPFKKEREEPMWEDVELSGKVYQTLIKVTNKLSKADEDLRHSQQRVAVYQQRFEMEEELRKKHEEKIFEEKSKKERLVRELASVKKAHSSSNVNYEQASALNSRLEKENDDKRQEIKQLKNQIRDLNVKTSSFNDLQKENGLLKDGLNKKKARMDEMKTEINSLNKEVKRLKKMHQETSEILDKKESQVKSLTIQRDTLAQQVQQRDENIKQLLTRLDSLESQLATFSEGKEKEVGALITERKDLIKRLKFQRKQTRKLQEELAKMATSSAVSKYLLQGLNVDHELLKESSIMQKTQELLAESMETEDNLCKYEEEVAEEPQPESENAELEAFDVPIPAVRDYREPLTMMRLKVYLLGAQNRAMRKQYEAEAKAHKDCVESFRKSMADLQEMYETLMEMMTSMNREILSGQVEFSQGINKELHSLRQMIVEPLCKWGISCGTRLHGWEFRFNTRQDAGLQTNDALLEPWLQYVSKLSGEVPSNSAFLEKRKISKTICAVYSKRLDTSMTSSVVLGCYGDMRADTVFDAIMVAFKQLYGNFDSSKSEKHVKEFIRMLRHMNHDDLKIRTFSRFCGIAQPALGAKEFHFMMDTLDCIRRLMGVNWRTIVQQWEVGKAGLPVPCMMDALCNIYNTNNPAQLPVVINHLKYAITDGKLGPCVDLDTFVDTIINEFEDGSCPISPVLAPRRLVDTSTVNRLEF
ncbi:hypothetical protein HOP50_11g61580 [Chloropicon primus]|uniref:Uncharacterized protein n=1 Tax=Chloropicon primus TaxID=1764295 RepID=A0A5B8MSC6_9CHLO|nr:hypothetical protein A3770_11p61360 [Chloropicon primus]UPR02831.1 hypothetical protein HOP50_11g61580 [Chloropicon primus]|eukprot:QDZ23618.1 hypothetical protein A3770_11p61360 [Chloropicon primus]